MALCFAPFLGWFFLTLLMALPQPMLTLRRQLVPGDGLVWQRLAMTGAVAKTSSVDNPANAHHAAHTPPRAVVGEGGNSVNGVNGGITIRAKRQLIICIKMASSAYLTSASSYQF